MIFDGIEFKPLMHKMRHLPDYYISECAKILSTKRIKGKGVPKLLDYKRKQRLDHPERTYKRPNSVNLSVDVSLGLFPEYDYVMSTNGAGQVSKKHCKVNVRYHRAVMESWRPMDEFPPDRLKDCWKDIPEEAKQWIRDSTYVDHVDADTSNNNLSNLRWCTPLENSNYRKNSK